MIDGIRQNLTYLDAGSRKSGKADAGSASPARTSTGSLAGSLGAELVQISAMTTEGANTAPIDKSRIEAIRDAIRRNAYPLDFEKLAERMIESDFGLSPRK